MSRANPRFHRTNPLPPTLNNNVYRIRVLGKIENQLTVSTFWYSDELAVATATATTMAACYNAFVGAAGMSTKFLACMSADWTWTGTLVDCPANPSLATYGVLSNVAGTGPVGHEPTYVAAIITRTTVTKGQCGRGHVSLPAVPTGWVTGSQLTTTTAYGNLTTQMLLTMTNGGHTFTPGLFSRGNRLVKQFGWTPLFNAQINITLGTVRRRKLGRGK